VLIDIFARIDNFFKRLKLYMEVRQIAPMTDAIVTIMTEVLSIFAIATKEIKQGRLSESIDIHKFLTYVLQKNL